MNNVIGHVMCPVCGHDDAQVKTDKNGHAFIFCPDCAAQTFTRNEYRDRQLRKRMRPVTVTVPSVPTIPPVTVPPVPKPITKPPVPPVPKPAAVVPPVPPEPEQKLVASTTWFSTLLHNNGGK